MELRFNPMKRNRGGEQDLDHIIAAAVRGMDKATLEYPVKPGLIFCLDRAFPYELNEIIAEKAIAWRDRGVVGIDIAGPEASTFRVADYRRLFRRARQYGLGLTVHTGESGPGRRGRAGRRAARAGPHRPRRQGGLRPARDGDDPRARHRARDLPDLEPEHPGRVAAGTSSAGSSTRSGATRSGSRSTPTARRCSRPTSATRWRQLGRLGILSVADQEQAAATSLAASFVPNVTDVPAPRARAARARGRGARGGLRPARPARVSRWRCRSGTCSSDRPRRCASRARRRRRGPRGRGPARPGRRPALPCATW